ncbi:hypothetical protein ACFVAQ_03390 [Streptomyces sp. NPDC057651]
MGLNGDGLPPARAQVQTLLGRRLPWAAMEITGLLVSLLAPPKPLN